MKTIIFIILGILLGIGAIKAAISTFVALCSIKIMTAIIGGIITYGLAWLAGICFKKA